ncbi:MAG: DUF411 domain-containing protein [Betaproteobacteria bacterium]|nr:DUF411 domain-containing protein [Betaproteobacteria bacterium]
MIPYRRRMMVAIAVATLLPAWACSAQAALPEVNVYKDPNCGCCGAWAEHMRRNGFRVTTHDVTDLGAVKRKHRVPEALGSCHTATVAGYAIEGHVPAEDVRRLLAQRPADVIGLAVPGMPLGSPGMESPTPQRYDVLAFDAQGRSRIFQRR